MYVYNLIIQYKVLYKPPTNTHTDYNMTIPCLVLVLVKVKVGVLRPVQQPGSYWDRSSDLVLVIKIINPLIIKKKIV